MMQPLELERRLGKLPRVRLAAVPTPLQDAPRLTALLGGPRILLKRDDLTGLAFGGNKVRQMEFVVGEAQSQGADVFICGGSWAESNHARVGAAAARAAGMKPVVVVRPNGRAGRAQGNALLVRLLAADVRSAPELRDAPAGRLAELACRRGVMQDIAEQYRARGSRPYVLPGSSIPLAVLGYVSAALELLQQCKEQQVRPDFVFVTSSAATQAGLELGRRLLDASYQVVGIGHSPGEDEAAEWIAELVSAAARLLDARVVVDSAEIVNDGAYAGAAHGALSAAAREAISLLAESEGILLDPVYTAKGLAGLVDWVRSGRITPDQTVVFIHTGGLPALFSYAQQLLKTSS